jgi:hypothetical protein
MAPVGAAKAPGNRAAKPTGNTPSAYMTAGGWRGLEPFELHMGPYHEFALFRGVQDEHRDHGSAENLLRPHTVELVSNNARH